MVPLDPTNESPPACWQPMTEGSSQASAWSLIFQFDNSFACNCSFLLTFPLRVLSEMFFIANPRPDLAMQSRYYVLNEREYFGKISVITGPAYPRVPAEPSRVLTTNIVTISQSILT